MPTKEEVHEKLLQLAHAQQRQVERRPIAKSMRDDFYMMYVAPYDQEIKKIDAELDYLDAEVRTMLNEYLEETGDVEPHEAVSLIRSKRLAYDPEEVIETLLAEDRRDLLRVQLKVRDFESAWKEGDLPYIEAEYVPQPTWRIGRLGDTLILQEYQEKVNDAPRTEDQ